MKNLKLIGFLMILASSLMFIQCTSDPIEGPQGLAGIDGSDGTDGLNGVNGVNGDNSCLNCHNDQFKKMAIETFSSSGHDIAAALPGRSGACLNCHSNEGYLASYLPGDLTTTFVTTTATKITCTTCHAGGHKNVANTVAGKDVALRSTEPYKLIGVGSIGTVIDYGGSSNNCIHCHQVRRAGDGNPANSDPLSVNFGKVGISSHFGPHYGGATNMLEGIDANKVVGATYPAAGTNPHRTGASCVSCHMGAEKDGKGSHSFKPVLDNCKTCHTGAGVVNYDINGGQTKIKNLMKDLAKEIVRLHPADFSLVTGSADPKYDGFLVMPSTTKQIPLRVANAVFNYRYLYQDHSYGVHNPSYATALMTNSIADLKLLPTP
ncbi:MAG: ammonia-forming cytochrome c nitrite reductase subunit c552 [Lutibacter sp.]